MRSRPAFATAGEYIIGYLPFVAHVTLMGMEMFGYVHQNLTSCDDPVDYREQLRRATLDLALRGMKVSVYNHQLCTIPQEDLAFCSPIHFRLKTYICPPASRHRQRSCAGFFQSAVKRHSDHYAPVLALSGGV